MTTYKLALTSSTYSCVTHFRPTESGVEVWSVHNDTMPGMGGHRVTPVEIMTKEVARAEWKRMISWGQYRIA